MSTTSAGNGGNRRGDRNRDVVRDLPRSNGVHRPHDQGISADDRHQERCIHAEDPSEEAGGVQKERNNSQTEQAEARLPRAGPSQRVVMMVAKMIGRIHHTSCTPARMTGREQEFWTNTTLGRPLAA
jgi:hypothetical protein